MCWPHREDGSAEVAPCGDDETRHSRFDAHRRAANYPPAPLRGLMNVAGADFSRLAARFSFSDSFAGFLVSRDDADLSDISIRFPFSAGGLPMTIAQSWAKSIRVDVTPAQIPLHRS